MQNFSKESINIAEEKLNKFKQLFPEVFSEGKVDFERLKLILGESASISNERYVLNWADNPLRQKLCIRRRKNPSNSILRKTCL
ncbi:hypothetical protein AGMMS49573_02150 [Endomicrobiia bacterium]|nr:hypothetical protein AGMMS49573_02150 [Endomicrobiia bacterium]GHT22317.1 hypothetical protein AGMMS49953_00930 [Endomicrobiia bacterium]